MNKGGFSWSRVFGISAFKSKIARQTGIPTTDSGRKRKLGAFIMKIAIAMGLLVKEFVTKLIKKFR
jgi:hypothetical protein